jgi:hypothetical protein
MAKIKEYPGAGKPRYFMFMCPGCGHEHAFTSIWIFNGDMDKPTVIPSILVDRDKPERRCHSFIKDGKIQFLSDCHHALAGKIVDLPEFGHEEDY